MELAAARLADARKKDQEKAAPKAGDKAAGDSTQTPEKSKEAGGDKSKESSVEKAKQSRQQRTPQKQVGVFDLLARPGLTLSCALGGFRSRVGRLG